MVMGIGDYACVAATQGGGRCRRRAERNGLCVHHQARVEEGKRVRIAPVPTTIIFSFRLNARRAEELERAGIERRKITREQEEEREARHIAQAKQHGRRPYAFREKADSGTPIFGKDGVRDVGINPTISEIQKAGYSLTQIFLEVKEEPMKRLLVYFEKGGKPYEGSSSLWRALFFVLSVGWGYCHVWANPPQEGKIVHTVNLAHWREEPKLHLLFLEGKWGLKEL